MFYLIPGPTFILVDQTCFTVEGSGQLQQKSPSMLHTSGTPQSHLSFGVNSNMTVTSNSRTQIWRWPQTLELKYVGDLKLQNFDRFQICNMKYAICNMQYAICMMTGGKRTERSWAVPTIRCEPGLRRSSPKRNLLFPPQPAHLWPSSPPQPIACLPPHRTTDHAEDGSSAEAPGQITFHQHCLIVFMSTKLMTVLSRLVRVGAIESCLLFQNNLLPSNCKHGARFASCHHLINTLTAPSS